MKKILIAAMLSLAVCGVYAQNASNSSTTASQGQTSSSQASNAGLQQGVSLTIEASQPLAATTSTIEYQGSYVVKNVPSVSGPNLTTSNDTCMGSSSASANGPGVGISFGTTWTDEHCKRLKMSRELWNKGMKAASLAMDCMDPQAKEALEMTGTKCPQSMSADERERIYAPRVQMSSPSQPIAQNPVQMVATTTTASNGSVVTRSSDGSVFVDMRTSK